MGTTTTDPLAAALDAATGTPYKQQGKVMKLLGGRPEVLEAIRRARTERDLTHTEIARILSSEGGAYFSDKAVRRFLIDEGIA